VNFSNTIAILYPALELGVTIIAGILKSKFMFGKNISYCFVRHTLIARDISVGSDYGYAATVDILLPTYAMFCPGLLLFNHEAHRYTNYT
jgi:hypothetical protein